MNKNFWINVHYGASLMIANIVLTPHTSTAEFGLLSVFYMIGIWGGLLPFFNSNKCFLVVLLKSIEKRKFLFPRVYKGKMLWFVYYLMTQYFLANIFLIIWIIQKLVISL